MLSGLKKMLLAFEEYRRAKNARRKHELIKRAGSSGIHRFAQILFDNGKNCAQVEKILAEIERDLLPRALHYYVISECRHLINGGHVEQARHLVDNSATVYRNAK